jgi:putative PIG3 family NAD(P)H quinone oxidoreductase
MRLCIEAMTTPAQVASEAEQSAPSGMRAVVAREPGGVDVLSVERRPWPELRAGEVAIAVHATALNRADLLQRRGLHPPPEGATDVLGLECAGRVVASAPDVHRFRIGEAVMALLPGGGYAERVVAPADLVMRAPRRLSMEQAACVPEAFLTASETLFRVGETRERDWVLVHAAGGGVGSAAVQLALAEGARVIATTGSEDKAERLRALGVTEVVTYPNEDFEDRVRRVTDGRGVDVILDFVGRAYAERHLRCLAEGGRWVVAGFLSGSRIELDLEDVLRRRLRILGFALRSRSLADKAAIVQRFEDRFRLRLEAGEIAPVVDRVYSLEEVREAHERMESNRNVGKIVLRVAH